MQQKMASNKRLNSFDPMPMGKTVMIIKRLISWEPMSMSKTVMSINY